MRMISTSLIALAMLATPLPAFAGDHGSHPPMGPPLSVTCAPLTGHDQFLCLRPGLVSVLADLRGLSIPFSGGCGRVHDIHGNVVYTPDAHGVLRSSCGDIKPI